MAEKKKKSNLIQKVFIGLFAFLAIYFVISVKNSNTSYKEEIKELNKEKSKLVEKLGDSVYKDSILFYLTEQGDLNLVISGLNKKIDSLNNIEYEEGIDFSYLSIDSNVVIFARKFSENNPD